MKFPFFSRHNQTSISLITIKKWMYISVLTFLTHSRRFSWSYFRVDEIIRKVFYRWTTNATNSIAFPISIFQIPSFIVRKSLDYQLTAPSLPYLFSNSTSQGKVHLWVDLYAQIKIHIHKWGPGEGVRIPYPSRKSSHFPHPAVAFWSYPASWITIAQYESRSSRNF